MDERQLKWVQQNCGRGEAARSVGELVGELLDSSRAGPGRHGRLLALLREHAGPALLDDAEPVSVSRGVLTFAVREPAILYHLRLQWEQRLLQLFQSRLPNAGISSIRFVVNRPR